ncbi:DNA starvation/stationary phase protection protein [Zooshikella marina]|uniref:Dps family protein n=1 Tax=Zooshikella ganghwensis TaxID=202772 RepID=UPI000408DC6C|nr:Dps family protein [Zooshikella ganghwensis]MBU2705602.1 DNA starvation/stationary phase protection protein [Zooshikella ganghwensis]
MVDVHTPNLGISEEARSQIADGLSKLLADSYTLYLLTHNFHWNVTGPSFRDLHLLFEEQYTELANAVDEIAERIRTLGFPAPGTFKAFAKLSSIEQPDDVPAAQDMLRILAEANESVVRIARSVLPIAQDANDESSAGLISDRMRLHEKNAWMLRSML